MRTLQSIEALIKYGYFILYRTYEAIKYSGKNVHAKKKTLNAKIILNGASFSEHLSESMEAEDIYVCNDFCLTSLFSEIRPNNYVIADQQFYNCLKDSNSPAKAATLKTLNDKANWDINLYLPAEARTSKISRYLTNPKIKKFYYSKSPLPNGEWIAEKLFFKSSVMPYIANVSIPMVSLAIKSGHKKINIYGLDMSYYKNFMVDEKNSCTIKQSYFYDQDTKEPYLIYAKREGGYVTGTPRVFFERIFQTICSHNSLAKIARSHGTTIINHSPESIINAYDKS